MRVILAGLLILPCYVLFPQNLPDSLANENILPDTIAVNTDTIAKKESKNAIESQVKYNSKDSMRFDIPNKKVYLFGNAEIFYEDITLKANYVEIDFGKSLLYACGLPDSTGKITGTPEFMEGELSFMSHELTYNFETKKGFIKDIITEEGEGYLHGKTVKKLASNETMIKGGSYTTCDNHEHPHFEIRFSRAKVVPDDKIVTGPILLVIEDVPTPLFFPFGFFPNKKGQKSGILIPTYGEAVNRGFFLENGGYYFAINDYVDLSLRGDIYSRGSWGIKAESQYNVRYRYSGRLNINYSINILGEENTPSYSKSRDFFVTWSHQQSEKARPNSRFSANVNAGSSTYNTFNPTSASDYLSNTFSSNISYSTSWNNRYFFSTNLGHTQNTLTKTVNLDLPQVTFNVARFYPLRAKERLGKLKWYENISLTYVMDAKNTIDTYDSLLFTSESLKGFNNGIKHYIPISSTIKLFKHFNLTNTFNYTERWYSKYYKKTWNSDTSITGVEFLDVDTLYKFKAARDFYLSTTLNTTLYGMLQFKRGPVTALRHVVNPSVTFSYKPDFGTPWWGYYDSYQATGASEPVTYSIFEGTIYGSPPMGRSNALRFSISNNLEMKVRSRKDTITGTKKIKLIENLTLSSGYDFAKDSLQWSRLSVSGYTVLFKGLDIRFAGLWDPYIVDSSGRNINKFEWDVNHRLLRFNNSEWIFGLNYQLSSSQLSGKKSENNIKGEKFPDPWNLGISYTLRYTNIFEPMENKIERNVIQNLSIHGDLHIAPKLKIGFTTGYDFEMKKFSYTSIDFTRDLHCWEMSLNWIPIGFRKSYFLTIRAKSSLLQDLKLTKKKDWRDF